MNLKITEADYRKLVQEVQVLDRAYFQESRSLVTDKCYDAKLRQLAAWEQLYPLWVTDDSHTQKLPDDRRPLQFLNVAHTQPMLSLEKVFEVEALDKWRRKFDYQEDYILEPKVDGLAIDLRYEQGELVRALTRGDGASGDVVTWQAGGVAGIPQRLGAPWPSILHVRGEVFMLRSVFRQVNLDRIAAGKDLLANPRNAAAGAIKSLDAEALRERKLRFLPYGVGYSSPDVLLPAQEGKLLGWLNGIGFAILPLLVSLPSASDSEDWANQIAKFNFERQHLDFATDGLVIKLNNLRFRENLPKATRVHVGAIAYKYAAEEVETVCTGVTFQVGRSGAIAPVAELEPVEIDGTMVSRASLHNRDNIAALGLGIGDTVTVRKAGEIIPEVVGVAIKSPTAHPVIFPTECPVCAAVVETRINEDGSDTAALFCSNHYCRGQVLGRLEHWCARDAMDVKSVGPETLQLMQEKLCVDEVADLYRVTEAQLQSLPGFGLVKADKVLAEIEASKAQGLSRVLAGFGIPKFGRTLADKVAREYADLWSFATSVQVAANGGAPHALLGPVVTRNLGVWLVDNASRLQHLEALGVSLKSKSYVPQEERQEPLKGWKVVFTGSLQMDRDAAAALVKERGGQVVGSVSGKTTHLVVGAEPGSKLDKAKKLGITILDEDEFKAAVGKV